MIEISERLIHCEILAPNAHEQNPVEDIWLQTKNFLRKFWYQLNPFSIVKWLFKFFLQNEVFEFTKLHQYNFFTQTRSDHLS